MSPWSVKRPASWNGRFERPSRPQKPFRYICIRTEQPRPCADQHRGGFHGILCAYVRIGGGAGYPPQLTQTQQYAFLCSIVSVFVRMFVSSFPLSCERRPYRRLETKICVLYCINLVSKLRDDYHQDRKTRHHIRDV